MKNRVFQVALKSGENRNFALEKFDQSMHLSC